MLIKGITKKRVKINNNVDYSTKIVQFDEIRHSFKFTARVRNHPVYTQI